MRPAYSVLNHDEWKTTNLEPMRDWRLALSAAIPSIKLAVMKEGN
jgi:dTDP-4-dehydrorhamnose reductase